MIILAAIGGMAVLIATLSYTARRHQTVADLQATWQVFQLSKNVSARQPITEAHVKKVELPRRIVTSTFVRDFSEVKQRIAATDLPAGAYLQRGMLVDQPGVRPNQRAITILVDAETGVAGKVRPGDVVDIYASYQDRTENGSRQCSERVVANAVVLDSADPRNLYGGEGNQDVKQVVPVTFALQSTQSLNLALNESFSTKIRLALIGEQGPTPLRLPKLCAPPAGR
jgi:pilus assembly protein CpaB